MKSRFMGLLLVATLIVSMFVSTDTLIVNAEELSSVEVDGVLYTYEELEGQKCKIVSITDATGYLLIPSYLNFLEVVSIGKSACDGNVNITVVELPTYATTVEDCAFAECSKLRYVVFKEHLTYIGANAFAYTGLTELHLDGIDCEIHEFAFEGCKLKEGSLPTVTPEPTPTVTPNVIPTVEAKQYTYKDKVVTIKATGNVNVRTQPSTAGKRLGNFNPGDIITTTGYCVETGWWRIDYDGKVAYTSSTYWDEIEEQPEPSPIPTPEPEPEPEPIEEPKLIKVSVPLNVNVYVDNNSDFKACTSQASVSNYSDTAVKVYLGSYDVHRLDTVLVEPAEYDWSTMEKDKYFAIGLMSNRGWLNSIQRSVHYLSEQTSMIPIGTIAVSGTGKFYFECKHPALLEGPVSFDVDLMFIVEPTE